MRERYIKEKVLKAMGVSPVVYLNGIRQGGKSTLAHAIIEDGSGFANYFSLDNPTQMASAANAPLAFLEAQEDTVVIDEVQMVPELFRALKSHVDALRLKSPSGVKGKYLLTGSANIMALPKLSDPLVGRMIPVTLYPFAVSEVLGSRPSFITRLFNNKFTKLNTTGSLEDHIRKATFPEIVDLSFDERAPWFDGYLATILQRDVRFIAQIEKTTLLPVMLKTLAARAGSLLNESDLARELRINTTTTRNYRHILKMMFLTHDLAAWSKNIGKRLVKAPKIYISDTLLLCHLLGVQLDSLYLSNPSLFGHVLENFIATELQKLLSFSDIRADLYHFRTSDGIEVDFVLEQPSGQVAGIEVKASENVTSSDFKGLRVLKEAVGEHFASGVILYAGKDIVPFDKDLMVVPISALWS